jgi:hypothetical protein
MGTETAGHSSKKKQKGYGGGVGGAFRLIINKVFLLLKKVGSTLPNFIKLSCRYGRVSLAQLVRFLAVKLTHLDLNLRFNMCVVFMANYFFSGKRYLH